MRLFELKHVFLLLCLLVNSRIISVKEITENDSNDSITTTDEPNNEDDNKPHQRSTTITNLVTKKKNVSTIDKKETHSLLELYDLSSNTLRAGFEPFYYVTNVLIDNLIKPKLTSELLTINGSFDNILPQISKKYELEKGWTAYLNLISKEYPSLLVLVVITIFIAFLIPIIGLIVCSYRCCCISKFNPFDKKSDSVKRKINAVILFILLLAALLGTIILFFTNQNSQIAFKKFPRVFNSTMNQFKDYSQNEIPNFFNEAFKELGGINSEALTIYDQTVERAINSSFKSPKIELLLDTYNNKLSTKMKTIHDTYKNLIRFSNNLEWNNSRNSTTDDTIKLLKIVWDEIQAEMTSGFEVFDDLDPSSFKIDSLLTYLDSGLTRFRKRFNDSLNNFIEQTKVNAKEIQSRMNFSLREVNKELNSEAYQNQIKTATSIYQYLYFTFLGISIFMLLLFVIFALGLAGICARRMHNNYKQSCHRGISANFFLSGAAIYFISSFVLVLVCVALFTPGIALRHFGCKPVIDLDDDSVFNLLKNLDEPRSLIGETNLKNLIYNCSTSNRSLELNNKVQDMIKSEFVTNIPKLTENLKTGVSKIELKRVINSLKNLRKFLMKIVDNFDQESKSSDLIKKIKSSNETLSKISGILDEQLVSDLRKALNDLNEFGNILKDGHTKDEIEELIKMVDDVIFELESAQGNQKLKQSINRTFEEFTTPKIVDLVNSKVDKMVEVLPQCKILSNVYDSFTLSACYEFLDNFNTYWLTLSALIILYLIITGFSISQADLFRKFYAYDELLADEMNEDKETNSGQYELFRTKSSNLKQGPIDAYEMRGYQNKPSNMRYAQNRSPPAHLTRA